MLDWLLSYSPAGIYMSEVLTHVYGGTPYTSVHDCFQKTPYVAMRKLEFRQFPELGRKRSPKRQRNRACRAPGRMHLVGLGGKKEALQERCVKSVPSLESAMVAAPLREADVI